VVVDRSVSEFCPCKSRVRAWNVEVRTGGAGHSGNLLLRRGGLLFTPKHIGLANGTYVLRPTHDEEPHRWTTRVERRYKRNLEDRWLWRCSGAGSGVADQTGLPRHSLEDERGSASMHRVWGEGLDCARARRRRVHSCQCIGDEGWARFVKNVGCQARSFGFVSWEARLAGIAGLSGDGGQLLRPSDLTGQQWLDLRPG
jgi:hypothetical protein